MHALPLIETDSPVLSPTVGERNEPANLRVALRAIAELKEIPEPELAAQVYENARRLSCDLLKVSSQSEPATK